MAEGAEAQQPQVKSEAEEPVKPEEAVTEEADVLEEDDDFEEFEDGGTQLGVLFNVLSFTLLVPFNRRLITDRSF